MDIYFVQSILNIIWYIFSILFVLYKFTSFFSYIWNFIRFLGKFTKGIAYLVEQLKIFLTKRRGQQSELPRYIDEINPLINKGIDIKDDPALRKQEFSGQTFFTKTKNKFRELVFGKKGDNYIPLTDTRLSYINSNLMDTELSNNNSDVILTKDIDKHMDSVMQSNYSDTSDIDGFKNVKINFQSSSLYPPLNREYISKQKLNIQQAKSIESYLEPVGQINESDKQINNQSNIMSSLLTSELTENPFAEDSASPNEKNKYMNSEFYENKHENSNIFFESTFIKKWLNK